MKHTMALVDHDPWQALRRFTDARIALGRAGDSLPTDALLAFDIAHARARDAVHAKLSVAPLTRTLRRAGHATLRVHSAARDRTTYLRRPDLGRRLDEASRTRLTTARPDNPCDVVFVVADGLSAIAAQAHAPRLLEALAPLLAADTVQWSLGPVVVALQSRVALGDEIGALLAARQVAVLIGERPGLSAPDSLGVYLTWAPQVGRTDAQRNCISNIRPQGLGYAAAAHRLAWLLAAARRRELTGVALKDDSDTTFLLAGELGGQIDGEPGGGLTRDNPRLSGATNRARPSG